MSLPLVFGLNNVVNGPHLVIVQQAGQKEVCLARLVHDCYIFYNLCRKVCKIFSIFTFQLLIISDHCMRQFIFYINKFKSETIK